MGLDIRPGNAQWSYSGFHHFRERLAYLEGIDLKTMHGFCRHSPMNPDRHAPGECDIAVTPWESVQTPLVPLLNHSDCDGYLEQWECEQVLPRLRRVAALWATVENDPAVSYDLQQLAALIEGMEHVVTHGCTMGFH